MGSERKLSFLLHRLDEKTLSEDYVRSILSFKNKVNMKWRQKRQFYDEDRELQNIGIK
jgi:hypothetical protein